MTTLNCLVVLAKSLVILTIAMAGAAVLNSLLTENLARRGRFSFAGKLNEQVSVVPTRNLLDVAGVKDARGEESMKSVIEACLVGSILLAGAGALHSQKPALTQGISVDMPVASHAVEMGAADEQNATVVAITADGKVFVGIEPTEPAALRKLTDGTVYVKADSRVPYQKILAVLDALHGKSVVLLAAPPENAVKQRIVPPFGMKLIVSQ